jgi:hypothetical protein
MFSKREEETRRKARERQQKGNRKATERQQKGHQKEVSIHRKALTEALRTCPSNSSKHRIKTERNREKQKRNEHTGEKILPIPVVRPLVATPPV